MFNDFKRRYVAAVIFFASQIDTVRVHASAIDIILKFYHLSFTITRWNPSIFTLLSLDETGRSVPPIVSVQGPA